MYQKRLLKTLLVVLALALWASAAYGQNLTMSPSGAVTLTYTQFGTAPGNQTITVKDADASNAHTLLSNNIGSAPSWLTINCTGTSLSIDDTTNVVPCVISLNQAAADAIANPGAASAFTLTFTTDVGVDTATIVVTPAFTQGYPTFTWSASTINLGTYTQKQAADPQQTLTITSTDDTTPTYNYTFTPSGCSWLTVTALHAGGAGQGIADTANSGDTLTFKVKQSTADSATIGVQNGCTVPLADKSGTNFTTVTVNLTINPGIVAGTETPAKLTYQINSEASPAPTVTSAITATDWNILPPLHGCPEWLPDLYHISLRRFRDDARHLDDRCK